METTIKSNNLEISDKRDVQETVSLHNTILSSEENLISRRQGKQTSKKIIGVTIPRSFYQVSFSCANRTNWTYLGNLHFVVSEFSRGSLKPEN